MIPGMDMGLMGGSKLLDVIGNQYNKSVEIKNQHKESKMGMQSNLFQNLIANKNAHEQAMQMMSNAREHNAMVIAEDSKVKMKTLDYNMASLKDNNETTKFLASQQIAGSIKQAEIKKESDEIVAKQAFKTNLTNNIGDFAKALTRRSQ